MAVGMQSAGQYDDERFRLWVDPKAGPGKAGVSEARITEKRTTRRAIARLHVPAQPSALACGRCSGVDHGAHRQGRENSATVGPDSTVQDHLGENRQIVSGRE